MIDSRAHSFHRARRDAVDSLERSIDRSNEESRRRARRRAGRREGGMCDLASSDLSSWDILSVLERGRGGADVVARVGDDVGAFDDEAFWNGIGVGVGADARGMVTEDGGERRGGGDEETATRRRGGARRFERALAACEASIEALCGGALVDGMDPMEALDAPMRRPTGAATTRRRVGARRGAYRLAVEASVEKLEDGFRWRKYGNKMLSGQRHPRGYYKCTTVPKTAKFHKQVERTSSGGGAAEERYLITYYGDRDILDALYRRLQSESSRGTAKIGSILSTRR